MAEKEEVEPTDEAGAAELSDATTRSSAGQRTRVNEEPASEDESLRRPPTLDDSNEADEAAPVDEFDEIVRNSGSASRKDDPDGDAQV